jgi:hypothetical protein
MCILAIALVFVIHLGCHRWPGSLCVGSYILDVFTTFQRQHEMQRAQSRLWLSETQSHTLALRYHILHSCRIITIVMVSFSSKVNGRMPLCKKKRGQHIRAVFLSLLQVATMRKCSSKAYSWSFNGSSLFGTLLANPCTCIFINGKRNIQLQRERGRENGGRGNKYLTSLQMPHMMSSDPVI